LKLNDFDVPPLIFHSIRKESAALVTENEPSGSKDPHIPERTTGNFALAKPFNVRADIRLSSDLLIDVYFLF